MQEKILRNSAKCLKCGEEVESRHRHDFRRCCCGALAVDGGQDYLRRVTTHPGAFEETSILEPDASRAP